LFYVPESKDRAVEWIRQYMEQRGFNITTNQILSKFQSLRTYFCSQRNKLINLRKNGAGEDVESKWRFYKDLMFLDQNMKQREKPYQRMLTPRDPNSHDNDTRDSVENFPSVVNNDQESYSDNSMINIGSHSQSSPNNAEIVPTPGFTNLHVVSTNDRILPTLTSAPNAKSTIFRQTEHSRRHEDMIFGQLVGNMMTHIPSSQGKDYLKLEIQQLIIKQKYHAQATNMSVDRKDGDEKNDNSC